MWHLRYCASVLGFANYPIMLESLHLHLLLINALEEFDSDIRLFFSKCTGVDTPDQAWHQARLSLRRGGLGLRSLAHHSSAAYMASLSNSNSATSTHCHLASAIT
jgi:hypothetical protein